MSELRRQALTVPGSGKTISRKARSRQSSAASSRVASRQASRVNSRVGSRANTDDEGSSSDGTCYSLDSFAGSAPTVEEELPDPGQHWKEVLGDMVNRICDRKKSSYLGREEALREYAAILSAKFAKEEITRRKSDIIASCLHSIKAPRTEKESLLAAKALALTIITDPSEDVYDAVAQTFKRVITDHDSHLLKCALIHNLSAAAFYGGATTAETEGIMNYLLDIIESDGHSAGAGDDAGVVTAALEEWGFLCTQLEDAEEITTNSIDALIDQLESSEVPVQVAAGENIALLYEKSYTEAEEDELDDATQAGTKWVQRYKPYGRTEELKETLTGMSSGSRRYLSKRNKKTQRSAFADILHSLDDPLKGPRFSEALDKDGAVRGSRLKVRVHKTGILRVDKWWKLLRVQHLKRLLGGGFLTHWTENPIIFESLSLFVEQY